MEQRSTGAGRTEICVVGAGPRGISVVERVCANAGAAADLVGRIVVNLVDPWVGRGGQVWSTGQPAVLLMNTIACQITMFTDDSVDCAGPIRPGPSLYDWAREMTSAGWPGRWPERVPVEAAGLGPDSYPSRMLYGHYLSWVLDELVRTVPDNVTVRQHRAVAVDVADAADGTQVVTLCDGQRLRRQAAVVLAQGHLDMPATGEEAALTAHAERHGLAYRRTGSPAMVDVEDIRPGEAVGLRGMGLNFFDYLALFTVGRGGSFVRSDGRLTYRPSGREPLLVAGSRRGVPYHGRGNNQKGATGRHEPWFLTPRAIAALRRGVIHGRPPEFRRDVWPLISSEVQGVYYHTLITERAGEAEARRFRHEYVAAVGAGTPPEPLLHRYGIAPPERWDWERITAPYRNRSFTGPEDYQRWLVGYLRRDHAECLRGNVRGPLKAALDVMRDLRNEVRLAVDHGGLTGRSYREELQGWYTPLNAFVSIGPPADRIEEMIALIEAGQLRVLGPGLRVDPCPQGDGFLMTSATVPGSPVRVRALIEARLPDVDIRRTTDPLLRNLFDRGECSAYRIPDPGRPAYETGGMAVTHRPYRLIDAAREVHRRRYGFGLPTEAVHWATAAGIRPGVNSVILGDADAIARACLSLPRVPPRAATARPPAPVLGRFPGTTRRKESSMAGEGR